MKELESMSKEFELNEQRSVRGHLIGSYWAALSNIASPECERITGLKWLMNIKEIDVDNWWINGHKDRNRERK